MPRTPEQYREEQGMGRAVVFGKHLVGAVIRWM